MSHFFPLAPALLQRFQPEETWTADGGMLLRRPQDDRGFVTAEPLRIGEHRPDPRWATRTRHIIEVAFWIGLLERDRRREEFSAQRHHASQRFDGTRRTQAMSDHRFRRAHWNAIG